MDKILNLDLMKNPFNWVTVALMVILAGIFMDIVFRRFSNPGMSIAPANS